LSFLRSQFEFFPKEKVSRTLVLRTIFISFEYKTLLDTILALPKPLEVTIGFLPEFMLSKAEVQQ